MVPGGLLLHGSAGEAGPAQGFQPLGEVIKMWGRCILRPRAPHSPPRSLVSVPALAWNREGKEVEPGQREAVGAEPDGGKATGTPGLTQGNMDQERLKKQQELAAAQKLSSCSTSSFFSWPAGTGV